MKKYYKNFISILMASTLFLLPIQHVLASEPASDGKVVYQNTADQNIPFLGGQLQEIYVKDGALYANVLTSFDNDPCYANRTIGVCPSKIKTRTKKYTRQELVNEKNKLKRSNNLAEKIKDFILSFLPGGVLITGIGWLPMESTTILDAMEEAIDRYQLTYTVTVKWTCVQTNFGIRGIVHNYKFTSINIK